MSSCARNRYPVSRLASFLLRPARCGNHGPSILVEPLPPANCWQLVCEGTYCGNQAEKHPKHLNRLLGRLFPESPTGCPQVIHGPALILGSLAVRGGPPVRIINPCVPCPVTGNMATDSTQRGQTTTDCPAGQARKQQSSTPTKPTLQKHRSSRCRPVRRGTGRHHQDELTCMSCFPIRHRSQVAREKTR